MKVILLFLLAGCIDSHVYCENGTIVQVITSDAINPKASDFIVKTDFRKQKQTCETIQDY